jgi:replication factor A1
LKEYSLSKDKFYGGQGEATFSKVADISEDGKWVNLKVKVVQIWEKLMIHFSSWIAGR